MGGCDVDDQLFQDVPDSNLLFARSFMEREIYVAPNMVNTNFNLLVYRSGVKNTSAIEARVGVNEQLLADYNQEHGTSFQMLPESYFSYDNRVMIAAGEEIGTGVVTIQASKIVAELGFNDYYAIPFVLQQSEGVNISETHHSVIINVSVKEPFILQETYGLLEASAVGTGVYKKTLRVYVEFDNEWDIDFAYELDEELLDEYNTINETDFQLLDLANLSGLPGQFTIPNGENSVEIEITISADGLEYFDPLMLPLRLVSLSDFMVAQEREVLYLLFTRNFDPASAELIPLTADMIDAWTQESSEGPKESLIDGDTGTYWHSAWSSNVEPLPHWIQINFQQPTTIGGMNYTFRQPSGITDRPNHWDVQVSDNGSDWTTVWTSKTDLPVEPVDAKQTLVFDQSYTSGFFRLRILDTYGSRDWTHLSTIEVFSIIE